MDFLEKTKRKAFNTIGLLINRLSQNESSETGDLPKIVTEGMPELLRQAGAEGTVLLRNDDVLPLSKSTKIAVFGRVQNDYMYVGYGSGGDVIKPYTVSLMEGFRNIGANVNEEVASTYHEWCGKNPPDHGFWGHWPHYYNEMPVSDDFISKAAAESECAVIVIGRSAGEDRENLLSKGSYYLTDDESSLIERASKAFEKTVIVLNIGSIMDMSWEKKHLFGKAAVLMPYQGGMESGNAVADVIFGIQEPSGRLTDTIADDYSNYPCADYFGEKEYNDFAEDIYVGYRYFETFAKENVLYPFGFGLGFTQFKNTLNESKVENNTVTLTVTSENIGDACGKDVIQVYCEAPQGNLGKPARVLCGFTKTPSLSPADTHTVTIEIPFYSFASFDDSGVSGTENAYLLEEGEYNFFVGANVRDAQKVFSFTIDETVVLSELTQACAPTQSFDIMGKNGILTPVTLSQVNLREEILNNLPQSYNYIGDCGIKLDDVISGKESMERFIAQLSPKELEAISRGDYTMDSPLGNKGNAGVMGGVLESLRDKGIKPLTTTDGPSGIRIRACCSLVPIGTSLASMWNLELAEEIYNKIGGEMIEKGSHILLAPGMNIHRSPLCGRNFEYYSEDPFLTGKTAAAVVKGVQKNGVAACPKHFACNSQETNRNKTDSRLSQRALREIYLKGFEICVKEAQPLTIMTSYNKINGVWGHYHYDLCTRILRKEWGFQGLVMTDWWMQNSKSPEFPEMTDNAYRVRAGVDVLMPGGNRAGRKKPDGTLLKTYGKKHGITLGEMQQTARRVVELTMKIK
ncbi:MAG: glycoside hydrolase family 3 C-terminal domain-containing protein [Clostridia bacterium]|nr:glycoside hydrolase family 3 C-terminal domain-containing protein [Clostridia bacterium]